MATKCRCRKKKKEGQTKGNRMGPLPTLDGAVEYRGLRRRMLIECRV